MAEITSQNQSLDGNPSRHLPLAQLEASLRALPELPKDSGRLAKIQLLDHDFYLRYADREHWGRVELPAERFVQSEDVAEAIFSAFSLSPHAVVEELLIRPQLGDL